MNLETIFPEHWCELTPSEIQIIEETNWDHPNNPPVDRRVISVIKGYSPEEKKELGKILSKIRKPESISRYDALQKCWLEKHEKLIESNLEAQHKNHGHEEVNGIVTREILNGNGEHLRYRLWYFANFPGDFYGPWPFAALNFLDEVQQAKKVTVNY